jgi:hypothetical protein
MDPTQFLLIAIEEDARWPAWALAGLDRNWRVQVVAQSPGEPPLYFAERVFEGLTAACEGWRMARAVYVTGQHAEPGQLHARELAALGLHRALVRQGGGELVFESPLTQLGLKDVRLRGLIERLKQAHPSSSTHVVVRPMSDEGRGRPTLVAPKVRSRDPEAAAQPAA